MREDSLSAPGALLAGLRLVSARTTVAREPSVSRLHEALQLHGAVVADLPLLYLDVLNSRSWEPTAGMWASYAWVCVTSGDAVNYLARELSRAELRIHGVQLVAVGVSAHDALELLGWSPVVSVPAASTISAVSAPAVAATVIDALLSRDDIDGRAILLLSGDELAAPLAASLAALGMMVTSVPVSRLTPDTHLSSKVWAMVSERTVDLFMVTSPTAVDVLNDAIAPERTRQFPLVCVGKHTARAARAAGFPVRVETEYANGPAVVRAIAAVWNS